MTRAGALAGLGLWLGIALAIPATADWLVTTDGVSVETRGAWEQKGGLIVFTAKDGALTSIRARDIDLEASRAATAEAERRAAMPVVEVEPPMPKKSVARLTDSDLPSARKRVLEEEQPPSEVEQATPQGLLLLSSEQESPFDNDGLAFSGRIRNSSQDLVAAISARVVLFDNEGLVQAEIAAQVDQGALNPGEESDFRAQFPSTYNYQRYEVRLNGMPLATRSAEAASEADEQR